MTFPKLSGFIHFSKTFPGLENAVLKFHDFSRFFMTVRTLCSAVISHFMMSHAPGDVQVCEAGGGGTHVQLLQLWGEKERSQLRRGC